MKDHDHLGFILRTSSIRGCVLIPRYYNPEIKDRLDQLSWTHDLVILGELIKKGQIHPATGDEIGKMAYGTGTIPFVRTSDISNWEIKTDPKQGVSEEVYEKYAAKQDVRPGDLLFVRDGTYLIGSSCLVTKSDSILLYQSHILKFRVAAECPISAPLLLALLSASIVRRQIRAKQFTADIIDTIGNRYQELVLPLPKNAETRTRIAEKVVSIVERRDSLRERLRRIPFWAQGIIPSVYASLPNLANDDSELAGNAGFLMRSNSIRSNVFVPRYYNPAIEDELRGLEQTHKLISIGELIKQGAVRLDTGVEVGKMAYGMGTIPFIRTSDISNWELRADPKQCISEKLYNHFRVKLDVQAEDLLVVRDGTYLVGTSCILSEYDTKMLYCGGIYKIRVIKKDQLDPYLLLALLNCPVVKRQMRAKQFTRDIIDTLGKRISEVILPIPKDKQTRTKIATETRQTVLTRVELRDRARQIVLEVEGIAVPTEEEAEVLKTV